MKARLFLALILSTSVFPLLAANLDEVLRQTPETSTFADVVRTADMDETLTEQGPYIVFAPIDSAFKRMSGEQKQRVLSDKKEAAELVARHIIPGKATVMEIKPGEKRTLEGSTVTVTSDNGLVKVNNASVIQSDVEAENGIVQVIDAVIER